MQRRQSTVRAAHALLLGGVLAVLAIAPAPALGAGGGSDGTVLICEATGNPSAPYVEIRVAQSNLGDYGTAQGDIIPAPAGGCPASVSGASAPVETGTATTSVTSSAGATVGAPVTAPAPATPRHRHHSSHSGGSGGVQGSSGSGSGSGVGALGSGPRLSATNPLQRQAPAPSTAPLHELPRTGGEVPLTVLIGLVLLAGAALPATVRRWRSRARAGA